MGLTMVSVNKSARNRMVAINDRGRVIGEDHHRAKLTAHDVELIRALGDEGMSQQQRAEKFEVSRRTIRDIDSGKNWSQLAVGYRLRALKR